MSVRQPVHPFLKRWEFGCHCMAEEMVAAEPFPPEVPYGGHLVMALFIKCSD